MSYTRVNWENLPSTNAPINATNLNKMDAGIANAVEKTGDTMTGDLNMQNNSVKFSNNGSVLWKEDGYGDKFRIIPDFTGTGSNNKLLLQSTIGDAGTDPTNWKTLVVIHADTGEIELNHPTAWTNATLSSNVGGLVRYFKVGKVVTVQFQDLLFSTDVDNGDIVATGLPNAITYTMSVLTGFDSPEKPLRVAVNEQGQIIDHYSYIPNGSGNYYGYLIYIAQD